MSLHSSRRSPRRAVMAVLFAATFLALVAVTQTAGAADLPERTPILTKRGLAVNPDLEQYTVTGLPIHAATRMPLHALHRRSDVPAHADRPVYEDKLVLHLDGYKQDLTLNLELNHDLFSASYAHIMGNGDKDSDVVRHSPPPNCHYRGTVQGDPASLVALSVCDGMTGILHLNGTDRFVIHPAADHHPHHPIDTDTAHPAHGLTKRHVMVRDSGISLEGDSDNDATDPASYCPLSHAHTSTPRASSIMRDTASLIRHAKRQVAARITNNKVVQLVVASDYQRYQMFGNDTEASIVPMVNYIHLLYSQGGLLPAPYTVKIVLAGIYTATSPMWVPSATASVDADDLLGAFCAWRQANLADPTNAWSFLGNNDAAHLLTARFITSSSSAVAGAASIEGYANVAGMCTRDKSCGFERGVRTVLVATQATVMAHELGHNFGAGHDGQANNCPSRGYIMEPSSCKDCGFIANQWSNCSKDAISTFFASSDTTCLDNVPSLCGNGVVDPGEECDSGNRVTGSSCCTPQCTLRTGKTCDDANGPCCKNCQLVSAGTTCRVSATGNERESCDLPDVCSGTSPTCFDSMRANGTSCAVDPSNPTTTGGTCNRGFCQSRAASCARLGYTYDAACDAGRDQPCLLYCKSANGCIKLTYDSATQLSVVAPDYSPCKAVTSGAAGFCLTGKCITAGLAQTDSSASAALVAGTGVGVAVFAALGVAMMMVLVVGL
ncbi:Disintegrin and metalloproteinase domain-containing protein 33 [Allomyces javanicus]|nr:Disintegrin and metalloproteinase domain-containing protein 33 [Allomyces javanicus]